MSASSTERDEGLVVVTDRIRFSEPYVCQEARDAVSRVLASGWLTAGPEVGRFEEDVRTYVGAAHAVAVASCTAALELALRALSLPQGARVLTPTVTFCGAVHAIVHAGLRPVFVDIDAETLMPSAETIQAACRRAGRVDAMVVLHFAGAPAPVADLAHAANLPLERVIEDAAHALGTWVGAEPVGSLSAATCFSFYATKNLPIGEGGMVTTNDPQIADYIRRARLHGMSRDAWRRYLPGANWAYSVETAGLKANMTDVQAAIGRAQLRHFGRWQMRRSELAARYDAGLNDIAGIERPRRPARGVHAWHLYVVRVKASFALGRDELISALGSRGIDCSVHFIPNHRQPYFAGLLGADAADSCPAADSVSGELLSLPLHPRMRLADVDRVCAVLTELGLGLDLERSAASSMTLVEEFAGAERAEQEKLDAQEAVS